MNSKVKRRPFGNVGINVSEVSFGAMNLRRLQSKVQAEEVLECVLDCGINLIDTARGYNGPNGDGDFIESEVMVGNAVRQRVLDEPIVIVTKGHGYTPKALDEELSTSLSRLGVTKRDDGLYIGRNRIYLVYLLHGIKDDRWAEIKGNGTLEYAVKCREEGKFNFLGFSSHYAFGDIIKEAIDTGCFQVCELPYNVFDRSLGEDGKLDLIKYAHDHGMGIINMKAFNGNSLVPVYPQISSVCRISYADMLRFCLSNQYISAIDAGARYPAEFTADVEASLGEKMSPEDRAALKTEADLVAPYLDKICRECLHCLEKFACPFGVDFPQILGIHARYSIAKSLKRDVAEYKRQYQELEKNALSCHACGGCNPWCEYKLDIPELLKTAHKDLSE